MKNIENLSERIERLKNDYFVQIGIEIPYPEIQIADLISFRDYFEALSMKSRYFSQLSIENPAQYNLWLDLISGKEYRETIAVYDNGRIIIPEIAAPIIEDFDLAHELFHVYQDKILGTLPVNKIFCEEEEIVESDVIEKLIIEGFASYFANILQGPLDRDSQVITTTLGEGSGEKSLELKIVAYIGGKIQTQEGAMDIINSASLLGEPLARALLTKRGFVSLKVSPPKSLKEISDLLSL